MKLYFLRHAQAEGHDKPDFERWITEQGRRRTQTAARVMAALGIRPAHIYSSPRVRARETAEIVAGALKMKVELTDAVNFGFSVQGVSELTAGLNPADEVMFVGHEPSMSVVIGHLTGALVEMKKGGLARVDLSDYDAMRGALVWLIAPGVFDALGKE